MEKKWFQRGYRRMLVDMHIPDWDPVFLSKYDPSEMIGLYQTAGLTSVMFYCQSHVGLCYWPTESGKMHAGLAGRDIVGEMVAGLEAAGIDSCAYYSVIFNNWAWIEHPEWRMETENRSPQLCIKGRYGFVCPNNPDYQEFCRTQTRELLGGYRFDGLFYDMTFWPGVCTCRHCREKFRAETGRDIPARIDWFDPHWCAFQDARERWMLEFAEMLNACARAASPGITVYHNFASALSNWMSVGFRNSVANDFLGADFYGDPVEQLTVSKLMINLSENQPVEFMTSRCLTLLEHESNKSPETIRLQALATTLFSGAMLFIDAINPDGTANPAPYKLIREVYDEMGLYEPFLGGEQVEDVGVYFSSDSKMDFEENGTPLEQAIWQRDYPHLTAVRGACQVLQEAHIPFGVITRRQLKNLARYKVIVLPNVLRMTAEEAEALRDYVRDGGRLYASRYTSLTDSVDGRCDDFMLADVFGCHFTGDDLGEVAYLKPAADVLRQAIVPQNYLGHMAIKGRINDEAGMVAISADEDAEVLATLTEPYDRQWGTIESTNWASIHSAPPWKDTARPAIVAHAFGRGRAIYSAADIECIDCAADRGTLLTLIRDLLDGRQSASARTHPCVWMSVSDQPENGRRIVGLLNYQSQLPAIPLEDVRFELAAPTGRHFTALKVLPEGEALEFTTDSEGRLSAVLPRLEALCLLAAEYA